MMIAMQLLSTKPYMVIINGQPDMQADHINSICSTTESCNQSIDDCNTTAAYQALQKCYAWSMGHDS